ncbi:MAG TPA: ribokinase, partial [Chloroflexota bacterium]|nr:ribokinase [Chloroflexota bacterium]
MLDRSPAIVVVGSANVDMIVRSDRLPQPGETVVGGEFQTAGGGKGANQAIAASRLGAAVALIARVGNDAPGQSVLQSYRDEGLDLSAVTVDPDAKTGVALILVDAAGQNMIAVASGANGRLTPADVLVGESAIRSARVLLVQSEVPLETVRTALRSARQFGVTTILNPAPARESDNSILEYVDWLTPNELEATTLTGLVVDDVESATLAGQLLV